MLQAKNLLSVGMFRRINNPKVTLFIDDSKKEFSEWSSLLNENDSKKVLEKIDFNGKL